MAHHPADMDAREDDSHCHHQSHSGETSHDGLVSKRCLLGVDSI